MWIFKEILDSLNHTPPKIFEEYGTQLFRHDYSEEKKKKKKNEEKGKAFEDEDRHNPFWLYAAFFSFFSWNLGQRFILDRQDLIQFDQIKARSKIIIGGLEVVNNVNYIFKSP